MVAAKAIGMRSIRRWFWLIPFTTTVLVAWLAADAVNAVIAADMARDGPFRARAHVVRAEPARRDKGGDVILQRNMFCSTCAPATRAAHEEAVAEDAGPPLTALPLALIAIFVDGIDGPESTSRATVTDERTGRGG